VLTQPASEPATIGWDDPLTADFYERFSALHARYRIANANLIRHAALVGVRRVCDLGAGTGGTARAALLSLGPNSEVCCVEPAAAMRAAGRRELDDPRVTWWRAWPKKAGAFDRILCGAAIWLLMPLETTFARCRRLLRPGGALCFDIPSLYLGEAEEPGGGRDPLLLELAARLSEDLPPASALPPPTAEAMEALLEVAGFQAERWTFRLRLTQRALADWYKIPVLTNGLLASADAGERARRVEATFREVDPKSWRWERWSGWTAWKTA